MSYVGSKMNDYEYIPWSGRRYLISIAGEIKDSSGNTIETFFESVSICCQKFNFQKGILYSLMKSKNHIKVNMYLNYLILEKI